MPKTNTHVHYGGVTKTFHWLTALAILSAFVLGLIAIRGGTDTPDALARTVKLFSLHKTIGILAFFTALFRIIWAMTQVKPGLLNADNPPEAFAAETVHWLLYGSMVLAPLAGWIHHAATAGFAPVLLPFGDNLFFVPKDATIAALFGGLHYVLVILLGLSILAHVGGALKHHVIDKDATLRRMLPGKVGDLDLPLQHQSHLPLVAAVVIYIGAIGIGATLGLNAGSHDHSDHSHDHATAVVPPQVSTGNWAVTDGTLNITVGQFGTDVTGSFANWTADITFDETPSVLEHGTTKVTIDIGSLTLGSVTSDALGTAYFNAADFPTATYTATLFADGDGYMARGTLTLRGVTSDLDMPFSLDITGDTAVMTGQTVIARMDYGVGSGTTDPSQLGLDVVVDVTLSATRSD